MYSKRRIEIERSKLNSNSEYASQVLFFEVLDMLNLLEIAVAVCHTPWR